MKNILFVCSANVDRSKTAEDFFAETHGHLEFHSAGTNHTICNEKGTNPLIQKEIDNADLILVMENKHRDWIYNELEAKGKEINVLGIEDRYTYYSIPLIELLQQKCAGYF